jgi:hypothetical protein
MTMGANAWAYTGTRVRVAHSGSGRSRRKSARKKSSTSSARPAGRKLKFGSPAWRAKYLTGKRRGSKKKRRAT